MLNVKAIMVSKTNHELLRGHCTNERRWVAIWMVKGTV